METPATKTYKVITESDICVTVDINHRLWDNPNVDCIEYLTSCVIYARKTFDLLKKDKNAINSLCLFSATDSEIRDLVKRVKHIISNSEVGLTRTFEDLFLDRKDHKKRTGPPLGQIKIFSRDLICFYNGKNWRKIKLR